MQDPTRDEMLAVLPVDELNDFDEFDREEAIYWFANDYHEGQSSNLYAALCASQYSPGPCVNGPDDSYLYDELKATFAAA